MPLISWATHVLQWRGTKGSEPARGCESQITRPSSDWRLQLASTKLELLVFANQHVEVNTFPGFVHTARQTMKVENTRSLWANRKEAAVEGGFNDWG